MSTMLSLSRVNKRFHAGTVNEKIALNNIELTLESGDFVTVIGGNGAGKSTLLNIISGVFPADAGSIEIAKTDITRENEHKRARFIGRVFQDPMMGTASEMTIEENLAIAFRRGNFRSLRKGIRREERKKYIDLLKNLDLGLEDRLTSKAGLLSGGQRQALTLLMATITEPNLLLLDEHTAALDPKTARKVLELTKRIVEEAKLTTLMVTHNMKDALAMGNRIIMLHEGRIILDIHDKQDLTVEDLMRMFEHTSGGEISNDRMLLT